MRKKRNNEDATGEDTQNDAKKGKKKGQRNFARLNSIENVIVNIQPNEPSPAVHIFPCNETGTFIEKITVSCSFCSQRFDRPDEYDLHYAEKHAKLYGYLPIPGNSNTVKDIAENAHIENNRPNWIHRKRRCSVYLNKKSDSSDRSDESSDNETSTGTKVDNATDTSSPKKSNTTVPKRNRTRKSSEIHKDNDSSSADSDNDIDDRHIINTFVQNINQSLLNFQSLMEKRLKNKRRLVYQCKACTINFVKESEWLQHLATGKHTVILKQCDHCMLKFSTNEMQKHLKMHEKIDRNEKKLKFHIITDTSYRLSDINNDISSEFNNEKNQPEPIPIPGCSKATVVERIIKNAHNNPNTVNIQAISNEQANIKKKYKVKLFKCDDCEEHFLNRKAVELHTKKGTHHLRMGKNYICNICTIRFSSPNTVQEHKRLHHNDRCNLSKEDFIIIPWPKWKSFNARVMISRNKTRKSKSIQNSKRIHNKNNNFQSKEMTMYTCEGCTLHFTKYKTWVSHLNRLGCKGKINKAAVKECPYCKVFIFSKNWIDHMQIHEENSSITKNSFEIISKMPKKNKEGAIPQSDVVSTTGENLDSNTVINEHRDDSSSNQGVDKDTTNAGEKYKMKFAKSTEAGANCWKVITNISKDTGNTNAMVANDCKNMHKDQESIQALSDNLIESTNKNTASNSLLINNLSSSADSINNATDVTDSTENVGDHNFALSQDTIPSTFDNIENAHSKSKRQIVIDTTGNNINEAHIKTNNHSPKQTIKKESNRNQTKNKITGCKEDKIKMKYFDSVDKQSGTDIRDNLVMMEDELLIKSDNNLEITNLPPNNENDNRNLDEAIVETDKTVPQDNIKIVNSFSMAFRFEEPSGCVENTINTIGLPETMHLKATLKQNKTSYFSCELENQQTTSEGKEETLSSNRGDKMQQREERDFLNDEDTMLLVEHDPGVFNSAKEETLHTSDYNNEVTNGNNNSDIHDNDKGSHSYETETQSVELSETQVDTNHESNVSVHKNNKCIATEIVINDKNTIHFSVPRTLDKKEREDPNSHSFEIRVFCFRDRSKANDKNNSLRIKEEGVED